MGEAKQKLRTHAQILAGSPGCIYCAGKNVATTIEHMPPISIFEGKQRLKGLEFPACQSCNNSTSHSDLVAAMLARMWPDADTELQQRDVKRLLKAIANNIPALLFEMHIGRGSEKLARKRQNLPGDVHPLRADGPLLNSYIRTFAAKLGFALHDEINRAPIPATGGVQPMWFSNLQALNGQIPRELVDLLPSPSTLRQGLRNAGKQFLYSYGIAKKNHMLYFATFNDSFAVAGITATDRSINLEKHDDKFPIFVPGQFILQ